MAMTEEERKAKHREYQRRWYQKNKEWVREYYEKNREKINNRNKEWRKNNSEKVREYSKKYYEKNKEYYQKHCKKYYQENREERLEYERNKREFIRETKDNVYLLIDKNTDEVVRKITIKELADELKISYRKAYTFLRDEIEYDGCYISEE